MEVKTDEEKIADLKEFCPTGDEFSYLGRAMLVVSHFEFDYSYGKCVTARIPKLHCRYATIDGEIRDQYFEYFELKSLKRMFGE